MAAQGLRDRRDDGTAAKVAFEEDLARQEEILEGRRGELLAVHPDKIIAVCAGEVFVGDTDGEAVSKAEAAHPDRPIFLSDCSPAFENKHGVPHDHVGAGRSTVSIAAKHGADAAFEEDLARQEEILEGRRGELLAVHPDKIIAVCAGEVFVGDTDGEAVSKAEAAHPDRPIFLSGKEMFCGCR